MEFKLSSSIDKPGVSLFLAIWATFIEKCLEIYFKIIVMAIFVHK
jgi:hypothetical protein